MDSLKILNKFTLSYYKARGGKDRICMGLDLNDIDLDIDNQLCDNVVLDKGLSFDNFNVNDKEDRALKVNIHRRIFPKSVNVDSYVDYISTTRILKKGNGFILKSFENYVGTLDLLRYANNLVLSNFGLIDAFRGQGLSKPLLLLVLQEFARMGISKIYLFVDTDNKIAISLYRSIGFNYVKTF